MPTLLLPYDQGRTLALTVPEGTPTAYRCGRFLTHASEVGVAAIPVLPG
jgi:hypothetical protein